MRDASKASGFLQLRRLKKAGTSRGYYRIEERRRIVEAARGLGFSAVEMGRALQLSPQTALRWWAEADAPATPEAAPPVRYDAAVVDAMALVLRMASSLDEASEATP